MKILKYAARILTGSEPKNSGHRAVVHYTTASRLGPERRYLTVSMKKISYKRYLINYIHALKVRIFMYCAIYHLVGNEPSLKYETCRGPL